MKRILLSLYVRLLVRLIGKHSVIANMRITKDGVQALSGGWAIAVGTETDLQ